MSDPTHTYTWDAANRLVGIAYTGTSNTTQMTYDGLGRRVAIVELTAGTVTSTKQFVWDGVSPAEERDASDNVTKQFFGQGQTISGTNYYYTRDHLGSVREMTDGSATVQARYSYDPYGVQTKVSGALDSDFQYAGYYEHVVSGIDLSLFRAYASAEARWLSKDPIGEAGGMNVYQFVRNNPTNNWDLLGLDTFGIGVGGSGGLFAGVGFSMGIVFGHDPSKGWFRGWSFDIQSTTGVGPFCGASAGGGLQLSWTNAKSTDQLLGRGWDIGGSVGEGPSVGVDAFGADNGSYWGTSLTLGASVGSPGEIHGFSTNTISLLNPPFSPRLP